MSSHVRSARAAFTALLASTVLLSSSGPSLASTAQAGRIVMGTVLEVTVVAGDVARARALAESSIEVARHWEDVLTTWRPSGELERLNLHAGRGALAISHDLEWALQRMLTLSRESGGAFDPAIGAIVASLRTGAADRVTKPAAPAPRIVDALRVQHGTAALDVGVRLDAGGIGKGMALDAIAAHLAANGATAWFLDFGGSSQLAHGRPKQGLAWTVLIAGGSDGAIHGALSLQDASLSTSRALPASDPAGAIIDPRTGAAVAPPRLATVLAADATTAEAWSKAIVVDGREGLARARAAGVEALYEDFSERSATAGFPLQPAPRLRVSPAAAARAKLDLDGGERD